MRTAIDGSRLFMSHALTMLGTSWTLYITLFCPYGGPGGGGATSPSVAGERGSEMGWDSYPVCTVSWWGGQGLTPARPLH